MASRKRVKHSTSSSSEINDFSELFVVALIVVVDVSYDTIRYDRRV